jgi:hypothetical protein
MSNINLFAKTNFRGEGKIFGIEKVDRLLHMYLIVKTGMGRNSLISNMALNETTFTMVLIFVVRRVYTGGSAP